MPEGKKKNTFKVYGFGSDIRLEDPLVLEFNRLPVPIQRYEKMRPIPVVGVSFGHWSIDMNYRSGLTLGQMYTNRDGEIRLGSVGGAVCGDPSLYPYEVFDKRITQPASYHIHNPDGSQAPDDVRMECLSGRYEWHKKPHYRGEPSGCKFPSPQIASFINTFSKGFKRKTRFRPVLEEVNYIDFGAYIPDPKVEHLWKDRDDFILPAEQKFVGHLIGWGYLSHDPIKILGAICKVKYIEAEGYYSRSDIYEPKVEDLLEGSSYWSTNFPYTGEVIDASANAEVHYGDKISDYADLIIVTSKQTTIMNAGWLGAGFWLVE